MLPYLPRVSGVALTLLVAVALIRQDGRRFTGTRALWSGLFCLGGWALVESATRGMTSPYMAPVPLMDVLTFKTVKVGTVVVALGYAFLVMAAYRRWFPPRGRKGSDVDS